MEFSSSRGSDGSPKVPSHAVTWDGAVELIIAIGCILLAATRDAPFADTSPLTNTTASWFPLIQTATNAFFMWQAPWPFAALLPNGPASTWCLMLLILFGLGSATLTFVSKDHCPPSQLLLAAVLPPSMLYLLFGIDLALFSTIAWIPWVSSTSYAPDLRRRMLLLAISGLLLLLSSWQLSVLALGAAFLLSDQSRLGVLPAERRLRVALLILAIMLAASAPLPEVPAYPRLAHLVPDDGLPGNMRPLFGPELPLPVINREVSRFLFPAYAWGLCLLFIALRRFHAPSSRRRWNIATCAFLLVGLDGWPLDEALTSIMPLQSFTRIIPGLFLFPLAPFVLAFGVFSALQASIHLRSRLAALCLWCVLLLPIGSALHAGALLPSRIDSLVRQAMYVGDPALTRIVVSPSHEALRALGWGNVRRRTLNTLSKHHISTFPVTIESSAPEGLSALADHNRQTRWTPAKGSQSGSEWLRLRFQSPIRVNGLLLVTGPYESDFPRGLRVRYGESCEEYPALLSTPRIAFESPSWQGRVQLTKAGYPYFAGQEDVDLLFPSTIETDCLLIEQTAEASFDWSVAELLLWQEPPAT